MPRVFVSYRRADTARLVGRIHDRLAARYGPEGVYVDFDAIPPGADFPRHVLGAVREADVLLAVIGPGWLDGGDPGRRRLDRRAVRADGDAFR